MACRVYGEWPLRGVSRGRLQSGNTDGAQSACLQRHSLINFLFIGVLGPFFIAQRAPSVFGLQSQYIYFDHPVRFTQFFF